MKRLAISLLLAMLVISCLTSESGQTIPGIDGGATTDGSAATDSAAGNDTGTGTSRPPIDCSAAGCGAPPPCGQPCEAQCGCCGCPFGAICELCDASTDG